MYKLKNKKKDKPKESVNRAATNSIAQKKNAGKQSFRIMNNQPIQLVLNNGSDNKRSLQLNPLTTVIQKKGDKYYWVISPGDKQYVGTFKNHHDANEWWKANKGSYIGYKFAQGSSRKKFK